MAVHPLRGSTSAFYEDPHQLHHETTRGQDSGSPGGHFLKESGREVCTKPSDEKDWRNTPLNFEEETLMSQQHLSVKKWWPHDPAIDRGNRLPSSEAENTNSPGNSGTASGKHSPVSTPLSLVASIKRGECNRLPMIRALRRSIPIGKATDKSAGEFGLPNTVHAQ